jgi:oxygen-independent coproporphyrinogen-3 oxidase
LQQVVAMAPDRVTLARYRHRPALAPAQCAIDPDALPDDDVCRALIALAAEVLCGVGYRWIGADHFVLETDPLALANDQARLRRNLIGYTATPVLAQLGLGAGALGEIDGSLFWNEAAMPVWREAVRAGRLPVAHARHNDARESQRRAAVEHLLCRLELPSAMLQGGLEELYGQLAAQAVDGVVQVLEDRIVVTEAGRHGLLTLCAGLQSPLASAA